MKLSKLLIFAAFINAFNLAIVIPAISLAQDSSTTFSKSQNSKDNGTISIGQAKLN